MASAGPRGRSRDKPITRMRIRVSSRMGTSEHRRRKKLQGTPDINHNLHTSVRVPRTPHSSKQKIDRSLVYTTFPDLQLQMQLYEINYYLSITCIALYLYASASLSLSSLTLPQLPTHCRAALLTTTASRYRTAWHREQERRRKRNRWRVEQHPSVLRQCNRWRKSELSSKPFQHRAI